MKSYLYFFLLISVYLSCHKNEDVINTEKYNTKIEFLAPSSNVNFIKGDTINILAKITSDVSMHGYEILLHKPKDAPVTIINKHTHGKTLNIDHFWVVDFGDKKTIEIEVVALIDHLGNNLSEKRSIICN